MNFGREGIEKKLDRLGNTGERVYSKVRVTVFQAVVFALVIGAFLGLSTVYGMARSIVSNAPAVGTIDVTPLGSATFVYDAEGNRIETLVRSGSNRNPIRYDQLPKHLVDAFVAIEDSRFWTHKGVDFKGMVRAFTSGLMRGTFNEGASTITQQLIKNNVFDGGMESGLGARFERKIQEQYLALQLEKRMDKRTILTNYLNTINLGSSTLGVQAAATRYFKKSVENLTLSESAVLAAITKNPTAYNPITRPKGNAERREKVLRDMYEQGLITAKQRDEALADNVYERIAAVNEISQAESTVYSYFVDSTIRSVISDLVTKKGYTETQASALVYSGGLNIYTTMDPALQKIVDEEISNPANYPENVTEYGFTCSFTVQHPDGTTDTYTTNQVREYFRREKNAPAFKLIFPTREELDACVAEYKAAIVKDGDKLITNYLDITLQPQASFVLMDQHTGYVRAISGGRGQKTGNLSLNRATQSTRQPGSTFKVLAAFAPAIDSQGATLASTYYDEPYSIGDKAFKNYWGDYYLGYANLRQACVFSMNIVTTKCLVNTVTPQLGYEYLQRLGFTTLVDSYVDSSGSVKTDIGSSLALGGITLGVKNLELTAAYATIANQGTYTEPVFYTRITDHDGVTILDNTPSTRQVLRETTAYLLTSAMSDTMKNLSYPGRAGQFTTGGNLARPDGVVTAGKSGTTTSNNDLWFVGFSPYYTAGIWSGYDENKSLPSSGYHKRIWKRIMERVHEGLPQSGFAQPSGLVTAHICSKSGKLAVDGLCDCDPRGNGFVYDEIFVAGTEPTEYCDIHTAVVMCAEGGTPAGEYCPEEGRERKLYIRIPEGASAATDDGAYALPAGMLTASCPVHTEEWYEWIQESIAEESRAAEESENWLEELIHELFPGTGGHDDAPPEGGEAP
ncbi:MAG: penicillin-binding protein [Lachnospiraceae bacterium]|nr:penicillin-binding protein [Lachnospiraceae bacterium]